MTTATSMCSKSPNSFPVYWKPKLVVWSMKPQTRCFINESILTCQNIRVSLFIFVFCLHTDFIREITFRFDGLQWKTQTSIALKIIHFWPMLSFHSLYRDKKRTMDWNWLTKSWKQSLHWFYSICQHELQPKYMVTVSSQTR